MTSVELPLPRSFSANNLVLVLDLCGTFVFGLSGGLLAVRQRLDLFGVLVLSFAAANVGGITRDVLIGVHPPPGIGGGMVRDILAAQVPSVLRGDVYAVAAMAGAAVVVAGRLLHFSSTADALAGAALCFGIRLVALRRGWQLPVAGWAGTDATEAAAGPTDLIVEREDRVER